MLSGGNCQAGCAKLQEENLRDAAALQRYPIGACVDGGEHFAFSASVYLNASLVHFHQFGVPAYY